jgi:hypothetical protein
VNGYRPLNAHTATVVGSTGEAVPEAIEDEETVAERTGYCPERRRLVLMTCSCATPGDCEECAAHAPDCDCEACYEELEDLKASYADDGSW